MYKVTWVNPSWMIRTEPAVLETSTKNEVRQFIRKARQYPGSYLIVSITKTTKKDGVQEMYASEF